MTEKITAKDIDLALTHWRYTDPGMIASNIIYFQWESDFVYLTKTGYLNEYEIKISRGDYKADFKKVDKHELLKSRKVPIYPATWRQGYGYNPEDEPRYVYRNYIPNYFWYVCPWNMIKENETPPYAGLIYYGTDKMIYIIKKAPILHRLTGPDVKEKIYKTSYWKYYYDRMDKYRRNLADQL